VPQELLDARLFVDLEHGLPRGDNAIARVLVGRAPQQQLGRPGPESVAPTRARLIEKGLIYSPSYGLNEFTVPQFDAFVRRSFPPEGSR
jgi:hypothetical protein